VPVSALTVLDKEELGLGHSVVLLGVDDGRSGIVLLLTVMEDESVEDKEEECNDLDAGTQDDDLHAVLAQLLIWLLALLEVVLGHDGTDTDGLDEEREDISNDEDGGDPASTNDGKTWLLWAHEGQTTEHHVERSGVEGWSDEDTDLSNGGLDKVCSVVEGHVFGVVTDGHENTTEDEWNEEPSSVLDHMSEMNKCEYGEEESKDENGNLVWVLVPIDVDILLGHFDCVELTLTLIRGVFARSEQKELKRWMSNWLLSKTE